MPATSVRNPQALFLEFAQNPQILSLKYAQNPHIIVLVIAQNPLKIAMGYFSNYLNYRSASVIQKEKPAVIVDFTPISCFFNCNI